MFTRNKYIHQQKNRKKLNTLIYIDMRISKNNHIAEIIFTVFTLGLMVGLVLVRANPLVSLPSRDSGSFLYDGWLILNGKLPYIDFWDSKPPAIFYLNAFGLWLGKGTRWGIWLLEFVFLTIGATLFFYGISRKWGRGAAVFGSIVWLYSLTQVLTGGNFTEEYPLLFSFLVLGYFFRLEGKLENYLPFVIGLTLALSFLFRANNIGIPVSILSALFLESLFKRNYLNSAKLLIGVGFGILLPIALVSLYFIFKNIFWEMIEAAITYNYFYSSDYGVFNFSLNQGLQDIGWPSYLAVVGYLLLLHQTIKNKGDKVQNPIYIFLLINWPIEIFLSSISGREYSHYFISWMPAIAVLSAYLYEQISPQLLSLKLIKILNHPYKYLSIILPSLILFYISTGTIVDYKNAAVRLILERGKGIEVSDPVARFIRLNTAIDEEVLIWGGFPGINFLSKRISPTKYIFYPFYVDSPLTEKMSSEFYKDVSTSKPKLIVDTSNTQNNFILSLDKTIRKRQLNRMDRNIYQPPYIDDFLIFVDIHYQHIESINEVDIYMVKD